MNTSFLYFYLGKFCLIQKGEHSYSNDIIGAKGAGCKRNVYVYFLAITDVANYRIMID